VKRLILILVLLMALSALFGWMGWIDHRIHHPEPGDYLRSWNGTAELEPRSVGIIELDDQGDMWLPRQLEDVARYLSSSAGRRRSGVVLVVFIHGWKSDASRSRHEDDRLAWFDREIERIAKLGSEREAVDGVADREVFGVYIGWRGRTSRIPLIANLSFWNRRAAAHRVATVTLVEILFRTTLAARQHPDSKCVLIGHSMGGLILEKSLAPALTAVILEASGRGRRARLPFDLAVAAHPSIEASYTLRLVDMMRRNRVRLVAQDERGATDAAFGPIMVSVTSESDIVNRLPFPVGMLVNSMFSAFRGGGEHGRSSQRFLGTRAPGFVPYLHSHKVRVVDGQVRFEEIEGRFNTTPVWVMSLPAEVSSGHSDISSPLFGQLLSNLMLKNRVFEPDVRIEVEAILDGG